MRGLDGRIWLGFAKPRNPTIDNMADKPFLRRLTLRLPRALWPVPKAYGHVSPSPKMARWWPICRTDRRLPQNHCDHRDAGSLVCAKPPQRDSAGCRGRSKSRHQNKKARRGAGGTPDGFGSWLLVMQLSVGGC